MRYSTFFFPFYLLYLLNTIAAIQVEEISPAGTFGSDKWMLCG
jgi:hypothetical protein